MDAVIETRGLTKRYGDFVANDHIDLTVQAQEIKCIVGENGAGKTTLMNMLYGLQEPSEGQIYVRGEKVRLKSPLDAIRHGIGMVHQHFKLVPSLTVYENIMLGIEKEKGKLLIDSKREIREVSELIRQYHFDLDPMDRIEDLSVGSRQRVEILKMLYRNVDILILDEPTAVLTPQEADELVKSLKHLRSQGKTIIVITHKLREVMELSDSVTVIKHGVVIGSMTTKDTSEEELADMMVGRKVMLTVQNGHKKAGDGHVVYAVSHLSTVNTFGKKVVDDISFEVHEGEILGIAGVEGNGQSELVKLMSGLMVSTEGSIRFEGRDMTNQWPEKIRDAGIGIIPEDRFAQGLCRELSLADNSIAGYHGRPDVCRRGIMQRKNIRAKRDAQIRAFDIRVGDLEGNVAALSGGNAQKIVVARELMEKPKMLIACQPTRGIDIGSIEAIHRKLLEYRDEGHTVILISSELSEVMSLSDRIVVMYKGGISGEVNPETADMMTVGLYMAGINKESEAHRNEQEIG